MFAEEEEEENMKLEKQLRATVREREEADRVCEEIFAFLEDVSFCRSSFLPSHFCTCD